MDIELCEIFRNFVEGLDIYTARKELDFDDFIHVNAIRNICSCRFLSNDLWFLCH